MDKHFVYSHQSVVVTVRGSMEAEDALSLREDLLRCINGGLSTIVINMADLQFIDSIGLGVLSAVNKRASKAGGRLTLSGLTGIVDRLLRMSKLDQYFHIQS
ncbi:MAG: STAS domain-containing protein [Negativicutes bacterium]|nr:STAS domain-containing protein [Negativicutes bacterium]